MELRHEKDEVPMRYVTATLVALILAGLGCPAAGNPAMTPPTPGSPEGDTSLYRPSGQPLELTPPERVLPERRVWAYIEGQPRAMDIDEARAIGLTIVDLSDDWVPYIFWSQTPGKDDYMANQHLDAYVDLANDRIDVDGVPLSSWERNYLEVYGIPPSLSVLRKRFLEGEQKTCFKGFDYDLFKEYHGPIRFVDASGSERELKRYYSARAAYRQALRKARVRTLEALLKKDAFRKVAEKYQRYRWRHLAIRAMQQRLACEKMFGKRTPKQKPGIITWATRQALRRFEQKHDVYGWGMMFQKTADALGRTPLQNNYETLRRVLTERVVSAARILEDGTIRKATYTNAAGQKVAIRNLVEEFSSTLLNAMGLTTPESGLEFMRQRTEKDFERLFVAVKLPPVPEYYADHMDISAVIDRGDVWYDIPFDEKGKWKNQPRSRYPHLTLYVTHNDKKLPIVRWRTTIGGWQPEMLHDEEYYKYKISDVGPRIWRHIVAGPVWVPPKNTPSRDMIKIRPVRGQSQRIVAHNAFGPGYASAYGLVAAFHVTPDNFRDNQVRTHGTVNYMSIMSSKGFSHGCHRLFNFRAVRLFSFLLAHRNFERKGQSRLAYDHRFEHLGEEFQMDLRTRGYYYELTPPIPVNVLEGNIKGELKEPFEEYVKKPTVVYQDDVSITKPKQPTGAPRVKPKRPDSMMGQPQDL